ncbi:hypothetical protein BDN70DRAFT_938526 [Pholiota conissans]|uniref:Plastocyanin-like domain-containing protein n=1 Tax=Pholiota conissans TaxID=109636 RepID=A0A9P5YNB3_9AGAR|nr:hypothetical protein BDN70DRAFT_938526 [Pholiota conissans]
MIRAFTGPFSILLIFTAIPLQSLEALLNYADSVQRDVVSSGVAGDNPTIRFTTDNAGPWIMHWFVL